MSDPDDELLGFREDRQRRTRLVAWVVIIAMILAGGGATVLSLIFR